MEWLQFWRWAIWPWLGNAIASETFLTLMVPVVTLTGVVITAKSNERIRHRELQREGKQWRYEVEKDNATVQRQAILAFLTNVADIEDEVREYYLAQHELLADMAGLKSGEYEAKLIDLNWDCWSKFSSKLDQHFLTLELSQADQVVRAQIARVREVLREDEKIFAPPGGVRGIYPDPDSNPFFNSSSPMSKEVKAALEELKVIAVNHLHPLPPEL